MCPKRLIFDLLIGNSGTKQVIVADGHDRAVAIGAASDEHVIRAPGEVVDWCVVDVSNDCNWCMLVCSIDHDLVSSRHCKYHPVW